MRLKTTPNILIADDHAIVRSGLKVIIHTEIRGARFEEAETGKAVMEKVKDTRFDLVILDVSMPETETFSLATFLLREYPDLKLLIFTINRELFYAKRFLRVGCHGYLNKHAKPAEIINAVLKILSGKKFISDEFTEILSEQFLGIANENPFDDLSDREFEVVLLLLKGNSISGIAETLNIHKSTVGTHKVRIFTKLRVTNMVELLNLARVYNLV